jgi:SAM-dependent methyltransferase
MNRDDGDWFTEEAFWATSYPFMFPDASFAAAAEQVDQLVALTGLSSGAVLDLACGPGRHAVPLARRGFRVTGVDATPFLLDKARAYAAAENVEVEWIQEDMRGFKRPLAFDLAVNLFTAFGYFESPEENRAVVRNVHASLEPGGAFVLDMMGKEVLARIYQPSDVQEIPDVGMLVQRRRAIDDWSRIEAEWLFFQDGGMKRFVLRHWIYSGAELKELLLSGGFETVRLFGNLDGSPYGPTAARLVAVARKGGRGG